jgi:uncharacterized membrane protein YbhN (UPF0104 family)
MDFRAHSSRLCELPARRMLGTAICTGAHIAARLAILPILVLPLLGGTAGSGTTRWVELVLVPFFVLYATALLPPPGGGGGVELTFAALLTGSLGVAALPATLLWWRVYTFYLGAACGALLLLAPAGAPPSPIRVHAGTVTNSLPAHDPPRDVATASCGYNAK